jgi:hypothetical protein
MWGRAPLRLLKTTLAAHKVQHVVFVYDPAGTGRILGMEFMIQLEGHLVKRLPDYAPRHKKKAVGEMVQPSLFIKENDFVYSCRERVQSDLASQVCR